jgi:hypothetical protein
MGASLFIPNILVFFEFIAGIAGILVVVIFPSNS